MMILRRRILSILTRTYAVAIIITAIFISPLAFSFVPIVVLLWYLFQWRRKMPTIVGLMSECFVFTAITLLLARAVGVLWSILLALPVLLLVVAKLEEYAATLTYRGSHSGAGRRRLTGTSLSLTLISAVLLMVALLVGNLSLALASLAVLGTIAGLAITAWRGFAARPVTELPSTQRMVAGSEVSLDIQLSVRTKIGGRIFLESLHEWVLINPAILLFSGDRLTTRLTLSPSLSGPSSVKLRAGVIDRWGLVEASFELEPVQLYIIPRARYAAWLVERYMAGTGSGALPLLANVGIIKPLHGWRRGVEYYGSRVYQPGDSLKNIDWKHSLQHHELSVKEFAEFGGRPAVVLVNLVAGDAEEADKLAYAIISTALSLARESIPTALAAYGQDEVKLTTTALGPGRLLFTSLQIARQLITVMKPTQYLSPPDIPRLRANIRRLGSVQSQAATALTELLRIEYDNLRRVSGHSAASRALARVMRRVDRDSNVIVISSPSSDADLLEFSTYSLSQSRLLIYSLFQQHPLIPSHLAL